MIKKFKTFLEAREDLWVMNPNEKYYQRLKEFYALAEKLRKKKNIREEFSNSKLYRMRKNFKRS